METQHSPQQSIHAYHSRQEAFLEQRDQKAPKPEHFAIDVNDLVGSAGERLAPIDADWLDGWGRDESSPDYYSPGMNYTDNAAAYSDPETYEPELHVAGAERALQMIAAEKAEEASELIKAAVTAMPEPVRTVAINRIILGEGPEALARGLHTTQETIEFLTQMAVALLAAHVTIR